MGSNPFGEGGFDNNADQQTNEAGWDAFGEESSGFDSNKFPLTFANAELKEALSSQTAGNKNKKSGLQVMAAINFNNNSKQLELQLLFKNDSGGPITDFDLMINKNAFGICPDAPCSKHGITYPGPFETLPVQTLPLKINK